METNGAVDLTEVLQDHFDGLFVDAVTELGRPKDFPTELRKECGIALGYFLAHQLIVRGKEGDIPRT